MHQEETVQKWESKKCISGSICLLSSRRRPRVEMEGKEERYRNSLPEIPKIDPEPIHSFINFIIRHLLSTYYRGPMSSIKKTVMHRTLSLSFMNSWSSEGNKQKGALKLEQANVFKIICAVSQGPRGEVTVFTRRGQGTQGWPHRGRGPQVDFFPQWWCWRWDPSLLTCKSSTLPLSFFKMS